MVWRVIQAWVQIIALPFVGHMTLNIYWFLASLNFPIPHLSKGIIVPATLCDCGRNSVVSVEKTKACHCGTAK